MEEGLLVAVHSWNFSNILCLSTGAAGRISSMGEKIRRAIPKDTATTIVCFPGLLRFSVSSKRLVIYLLL